MPAYKPDGSPPFDRAVARFHSGESALLLTGEGFLESDHESSTKRSARKVWVAFDKHLQDRSILFDDQADFLSWTVERTAASDRRCVVPSVEIREQHAYGYDDDGADR